MHATKVTTAKPAWNPPCPRHTHPVFPGILSSMAKWEKVHSAWQKCLFHSAREQDIYRRQFLLWMFVLAPIVSWPLPTTMHYTTINPWRDKDSNPRPLHYTIIDPQKVKDSNPRPCTTPPLVPKKSKIRTHDHCTTPPLTPKKSLDSNPRPCTTPPLAPKKSKIRTHDHALHHHWPPKSQRFEPTTMHYTTTTPPLAPKKSKIYRTHVCSGLYCYRRFVIYRLFTGSLPRVLPLLIPYMGSPIWVTVGLPIGVFPLPHLTCPDMMFVLLWWRYGMS
jgi:hypothetical protein